MATHHPLPADLTTGSVVLDIGGDVGALLIHTGPERLGEEIEVERVDDGHRTHVAVLKRHVGATVAHGAVYGDLRGGDYAVLGPDGRAVDRAHVDGGGVTILDWRPPRPAQPAPLRGGPPNL